MKICVFHLCQKRKKIFYGLAELIKKRVAYKKKKWRYTSSTLFSAFIITRNYLSLK